MKKWFTLVELIVVITILAILWTISYVSFWWFTMSARDSSRISDVKNIETVLETFKLNTWIYPKPTNPVSINYSWWTVFWQGTFWKDSRTQLWTKWNISNIPLDPLFDTEYSYSVQSTNRSYNISYIIEWDLALNNNTSKKAFAEWETREVLNIVKWNYNWQVTHTSTWWKVYVFAIPSLILSDLSNTNILQTTDKYVYNKELNIAASYSWKINSVWTFAFTPKLVFSWSNLPKTPYELKNTILNLKDAITWTYLYSKPEYRDLVELDINNSTDLINWWERYINNELWWRIQLTYAKTCKEIQNSDENRWTGIYTIAPNWYNKIEVYCDMVTDWGWWTRVKKWDRINRLTEWTDITKTKWIYWSEVMLTYTRYGKIRKNIGWTWTTIDMTWKKFWYQYQKFQTQQTEEAWLCWEHTNISDLITHITSWSWGDCSRSCQRNDPNDPNSWCNTSLEYTDIQLDDLWEDIWLPDDKVISWFDDDPCINNWYKNTDRNISWSADWRMSHRIDSTTSLITLWGDSPRCDWIVWRKWWLDDRWTTWLNERWIDDTAAFESWFDTEEIWVR